MKPSCNIGCFFLDAAVGVADKGHKPPDEIEADTSGDPRMLRGGVVVR